MLDAENQSGGDLRAENELLRLKLELEHGVIRSDTSSLGAELENQWLKSIYYFEYQYKNSKPVKVYDFIARPNFKRAEELSSEEISKELGRVLSLMEEKGIVLDRCCEYDDATSYRFITGELFDHEIDDIFIEGMTHHFIYEEFHPNHDYDLRRYATELIENLFERKMGLSVASSAQNR